MFFRRLVVHAEAIEQFEANINTMIEHGANDRETAIRWILSTFDENDQEYIERDPDYFNLELNMPYNYNWKEGVA